MMTRKVCALAEITIGQVPPVLTPMSATPHFKDFVLLVLFPDSFVDVGKLASNSGFLIARELLQVKRISGIRHIQMETVLAVFSIINRQLIDVPQVTPPSCPTSTCMSCHSVWP